MQAFSALLDRLSLTPQRNAKIRLLAEHFRDQPDPERGLALAAITGALEFKGAKAGLIRQLAAERTDEVLFALSLSAIWPRPPR